MAHLAPVPFPDLVRRMRREVELSQAIFDLPAKKWFVPPDDLDFSAPHFARRASTPVGPAAGPHTQLAQNIVLAWLAGSRILELKTVQVNDRLEIPRPCIHAPNVGFNVEWSQELLVRESLMEYAKAVYLVEILRKTRGFGVFPSDTGFDTVYDISVGYDLEGIRSDKVTGFLRAMRQAGPLFEELRGQLEGDLGEFRDLDLPASISDCVTLSTFHGCPADQIESIARYLIQDLGLHTILKLNPTLLGFDRVSEILVDRLGYGHLELRREAFDQDLRYADGLEILRRLKTTAEDRGTIIGAKFTNTLVVANRADVFPTQTDPYMYLSGPPLHVISMTLMQRFREDLGFEFPVSFSAGIDARNFPAAVACGMVPVTTCTDLLRHGGYARLPAYLKNLGGAMRKLRVTSREAYVLAAHGHGAEAIEEALKPCSALHHEAGKLGALADGEPDDLPGALLDAAARAGVDGHELLLRATRIAGRLNGREVVPRLAEDPRYHVDANSKTPRRIDSRLEIYDCVNCDLCITACPNDAVFAYSVRPIETSTEILSAGDGEARRSAGGGFVLREGHQLAVLEGACNECSNCEVYCPEEGAPWQVKERLFPDRGAFERSPGLDGFLLRDDGLDVRLGGVEMRFEPDPGANRATVSNHDLRIVMTWRPFLVERAHLTGATVVDTAQLWRMKTVWESIYGSTAPNMVRPDPE